MTFLLLTLAGSLALVLGSWGMVVAGFLLALLVHARRWRATALLPTSPVAARPEKKTWLWAELAGGLFWFLSS